MSLETFRYVCRTCGETHEGLPDLVFDAPFYYSTVPEAERAQRCFLTTDLCSIDDSDFFIRGVLEMPIQGATGTFAWGVWSSVSEKNFRLYQRFREGGDHSSHGPFPGWLSSRIPDYPDTLKLLVRAHLQEAGARPRIQLAPADHPLAFEQREGIRMEKLQGILTRHRHAAG